MSSYRHFRDLVAAWGSAEAAAMNTSGTEAEREARRAQARDAELNFGRAMAAHKRARMEDSTSSQHMDVRSLSSRSAPRSSQPLKSCLRKSPASSGPKFRKLVPGPQHSSRVTPLKRAAESNRVLAGNEPGKKSRMTRRDGSTPFSFSSRAFSRPKPSDAQEELSDESDESDSEADDEENDEHEEQELSENDDDDDLEDEASSSESDDSSDGRDTGARFPSMTRRPHTAAGGILARCTRLPSPVRIPANSIGLTYLHDFLSAAECEELIALSSGSFVRSTIGLSPSSPAISPSRTSYSSALRSCIGVVATVRARAAELMSRRVSQLQKLNVVRYEPGQRFLAHYDSSLGDKYPREYTLFVYLNTLPNGAGGETEFTRLGIKFKPRAGDALFWRNRPSATAAHFLDGEHAGKPVITGVKYGLNVWSQFIDVTD